MKLTLSLLISTRRIRRLSSVIISFFFISGCGYINPTYPKEEVIEAVKKLCRDEYDLEVKTKLAGKTLGIYAEVEGLIGPDLRLTREAGERVDDLALSISRVSLSTNADVQFYVIIVRDKAIPTAELLMVRYVEDVKRLLRYNISRNDYLERMVLDLHFNPIPRTHSGSDDFLLDEVNFEYFLTFQLQKRLRKTTDEKIEGKFIEQEAVRYFEFSLLADSFAEADKKEILELVVDVILKYNFREFDGIILLSADGERRELYRKDDLTSYGWRKEDETYARWFWRRLIGTGKNK